MWCYNRIIPDIEKSNVQHKYPAFIYNKGMLLKFDSGQRAVSRSATLANGQRGSEFRTREAIGERKIRRQRKALVWGTREACPQPQHCNRDSLPLAKLRIRLRITHTALPGIREFGARKECDNRQPQPTPQKQMQPRYWSVVTRQTPRHQ